jgi:hypothetical protein
MEKQENTDIFVKNDDFDKNDNLKESEIKETKTDIIPKSIESPPKSKFEFNTISIIFCIIIIILIAVIVWLIIKRPKMNTEVLTKTQEMYTEQKKKNKELTDTLTEINKKHKMLEEVNNSTMKENSALKEQLNSVQENYQDIQHELNDYKTKEAQEMELKKNPKPQTFAERKKEQYDKINKPNDDHILKQSVQQQEVDNGELKLDASNIALQQQTIKKQFNENVKNEDQANLEEIMKTIQ